MSFKKGGIKANQAAGQEGCGRGLHVHDKGRARLCDVEDSSIQTRAVNLQRWDPHRQSGNDMNSSTCKHSGNGSSTHKHNSRSTSKHSGSSHTHTDMHLSIQLRAI